MEKRRLSLGLDVSTQSLSAVVLDIDTRTKLIDISLDYLKDSRLNIFGIRKPDYILPPRVEGEADQPPLIFLAALDAIFTDLQASVPLRDVVAINSSGQQHGHIYLNHESHSLFEILNKKDSGRSILNHLLKDIFAYKRAPIWMTANTSEQAVFISNAIGGKERLIKLSGSDAQLRFSGLVIRYIAEKYPEVYARTDIIQLIGNFIPAVLTGNTNVPADFGNACGMSLMNYHQKRWSDKLIGAVSLGLPGGKKGLRAKLPPLASPDAIVGNLAAYFSQKYGFSHSCMVVAGSGDNPQSKVLVNGDLLSLGSSFVFMVATDGKTRDMTGGACAMYDGVGRPFIFGCRTNGALVWDSLRAQYGMSKDDYAPAERALQQSLPGQNLVFWQPRNESFPPSGNFRLGRITKDTGNFASDYTGLVESSLAAVYCHSKGFNKPTHVPLYVTGGAASSPCVIRRVAAIWNRPVLLTGKGGAALGAAVAGISAYMKANNETFNAGEFSKAILPRGNIIYPVKEDIAAFHGKGGYLDKFVIEEAKLIKKYPFAD